MGISTVSTVRILFPQKNKGIKTVNTSEGRIVVLFPYSLWNNIGE